jgi:hypothetical protein
MLKTGAKFLIGPDRRVFLSIGFDVSGQLVLILGSLALGSTRLAGGSLLRGQLGVT